MLVLFIVANVYGLISNIICFMSVIGHPVINHPKNKQKKKKHTGWSLLFCGEMWPGFLVKLLTWHSHGFVTPSWAPLHCQNVIICNSMSRGVFDLTPACRGWRRWSCSAPNPQTARAGSPSSRRDEIRSQVNTGLTLLHSYSLVADVMHSLRHMEKSHSWFKELERSSTYLARTVESGSQRTPVLWQQPCCPLHFTDRTVA